MRGVQQVCLPEGTPAQGFLLQLMIASIIMTRLHSSSSSHNCQPQNVHISWSDRADPILECPSAGFLNEALVPGILLTTRGTHMHEVASKAMASSRDFSASWMWMWLSWRRATDRKRDINMNPSFMGLHSIHRITAHTQNHKALVTLLKRCTHLPAPAP